MSVTTFGAHENDWAGLGDYLSARFAASHHDFGEASRYFQSSLQLDPGNQQLLTFAFFYAASAGDIDKAAQLARRLVQKVPDDRAARLTLAVVELKARNFRKARREIDQSAKGPFTSFTVALIDGWAAAGQRDKADVEKNFKALHAQHGADALAFFNEAMAAELLGDTAKANIDYAQSLAVAGPTPRVADAYGRFLERNGHADDARKLYGSLKGNSGFDVIADPGLARIAKGTVPPPLASSAAEGAAEALFGIAASLNDDNSRDVSILYLRLALYLQPKLDLATVLLASRFEAMDKFEDAIRIYENIGEDSPYKRYAVVQTAVDLARLDKTEEAVDRLKALTAQYPQDIEALTALGDCYRQMENYAEAAEAYSKAIAADGPATKKSWPLYYARAIAEHLSNNWTAAEADLKLTLSLSPEEPQVLNYLGYSWVDQRRNVKEALAMLEKARSLSPRDGYIIDSVGWAYYRLDRYQDAVKALEDAIAIVPGDPTINDHLGDAYWRVGRKLDAQFQWDHALAFGAEGDEKTKIEKKLKDGLTRDNGN